jgi:hypothetical protein
LNESLISFGRHSSFAPTTRICALFEFLATHALMVELCALAVSTAGDANSIAPHRTESAATLACAESRYDMSGY